jgi:hypothetical protein
MPAKSGKQYRFMQMIAHNPGKAKQLGVSQSVGKDFVDATPAADRSRFSKKKNGNSNGFGSYGSK